MRVSQSEDKRVLKSSSDSISGHVTASSATRLTSSWRQGLSQWLQRSRASSTSAAVSSNNNVVGGGGAGGLRRGSSGAKRTAAATAGNNSGGVGVGVSSAPISISIVSNHGHVRTLAPNSFGKLASSATETAGETDTTGNKTATDQCSKCCLARC